MALASAFEDGVKAYGNGDFKTALKLFSEAAKEGNVSAQYNIGCMFKNGEGTQQDLSKALQWFRYAKQNGHEKSENEIKEVEEAIKLEEKALSTVTAQTLKSEYWTNTFLKPGAVDQLANMMSICPISVTKLSGGNPQVDADINKWVLLRLSATKAYSAGDSESFISLAMKASELGINIPEKQVNIAAYYESAAVFFCLAQIAVTLEQINFFFDKSFKSWNSGMSLIEENKSNYIPYLYVYYVLKSKFFLALNNKRKCEYYENLHINLKREYPGAFY